jgi:hypothetical protein
MLTKAHSMLSRELIGMIITCGSSRNACLGYGTVYGSIGLHAGLVTVWNDRTADDWPQYDAFYKYDHRDRLVQERYLKYNSTTERMDVYRQRDYTYDNGNNMTKKKIWEEGDWIEYTLTYSKGYHVTVAFQHRNRFSSLI